MSYDYDLVQALWSMAFKASITYGLALLLGIPQPVSFRD